MYKFPGSLKEKFIYLRRRNLSLLQLHNLLVDSKHYRQVYFPYPFNFLANHKKFNSEFTFIFDGLDTIKNTNFTNLNLKGLVFDYRIKKELPEVLQKNSNFFCITDQRAASTKRKTFYIKDQMEDFKLLKDLSKLEAKKSFNINKLGCSCLFFLALYKHIYYHDVVNLDTYHIKTCFQLSIYHKVYILSHI